MAAKLKEYSVIYLIGSVGYSLIEILWRGFTHWSMAITGGLCFVLLHKNNLKHWSSSIWTKCARGAMIITSVEFSVGCVVNLVLKLDVWDYSKLHFNILGQVCPLYSVLWFFLCIPLTFLTPVLHRRLRVRSLLSARR
ncbi:putative ABC transporter permease [Candidatus Soleaferrea massiliensis]|uniref:putative ABC transporter permease n=1 Tax=Candidatus Soleaferrea massiliensis TaxID=1470354 RepID=UPI00058DC233|nr:membrane protein [Candidatus Soleaferrea massiliensis]